MVRLFAGNSCLARRLLIVFLTMFWLMKVRSLSIFFIKSGRQKVAAKLLFGRGRPANQLLRDLCLFDNNVFPFLLEFLVPTLFRRKVGLGLGFRRRHFSMNRLKDANWPSREVHKDFRI